jgi:hypothetical protein
MNRAAWQRIFPQILAWTALFVLCTALALAQSTAPAGGQRTDGQIEMDVVHALDGSQPLKNDLITAATIQGEVTLSGTVALQSSKALAEQIVKGVPGVTAVHNNLTVGNPANDPNAQNGPLVDSNDAGAPDTGSPAPYASSEPQVTNPGYQRQNPVPQYGQTPPPNSAQNGYPNNGQNQSPNYGQNPAYGQNPNYGYGQNRYPNYGQNGYPGYGQNGYGQQPYRQQYAPQRPQYQIPSGPVTVAAGTLIEVRTSEAVSSKHATEGTPVEFTVIRDVTAGGALAIPRGATVHGVVTAVRQAGQLSGSPELALRLTSLDLGGRTYPLDSELFKVKGPSKTGRTLGNVVGGTLVGALIGGVAGGGGGAAIGAVAGGTVGTAASAAEHGPNAWIPSEALVTFHLVGPVTVNPVTQEEANRLAEGLNQGGPRLQQRGAYAQPYGYVSPYYYPYGYAPVYYRPYYYTGGFYYWR